MRVLVLFAALAVIAAPAAAANATANATAAADLKLWSDPLAAANANAMLAFADEVEKAGLAGVVGSRNLTATIFAPSDQAFRELHDSKDPKVQALLANKTAMAAVLKYHVIPGAVIGGARVVKMVQGAKGGVLGYMSLQGERVNATLEDGIVKVNGIPVSEADIQGGKTMIHKIDGVLLPPSMLPAAAIPTAEAEANATAAKAAATSAAAALAAGALLALPVLAAALL